MNLYILFIIPKITKNVNIFIFCTNHLYYFSSLYHLSSSVSSYFSARNFQCHYIPHLIHYLFVFLSFFYPTHPSVHRNAFVFQNASRCHAPPPPPHGPHRWRMSGSPRTNEGKSLNSGQMLFLSDSRRFSLICPWCVRTSPSMWPVRRGWGHVIPSFSSGNPVRDWV